MIITITCNPAIDKTVYENKEVFDIGGKGINVSKVLKELGENSLATGFIGKDNKDLVINDLNSIGIDNHFIEVDGKVRTNTKRIVNNNLIEENEDGPFIKQDDIAKLFSYLESFSNELVIISGSAPSSADKNIYKDMVELLHRNDNFVILDCDKELFKNGVEAKPDVIKPNKEEICKYLNMDYNESEIIDRLKKLGIDLVCLSLGSDGAIFISEDVYKCEPLKIEYSSAVGAGDAMVAAIAYSKSHRYDIEKTIKLAISAASAACETEGTKPPKYKDIVSKLDDVIYKKQC